jgi:MYXO-CTERM domain-containing protein
MCIEDPCYDISCEVGQTCVDGICTEPCDNCAPDEACIQGICRRDPCSGVECPPGQVCEVDDNGDAQCVGDWTQPAAERDAGMPVDPEADAGRGSFNQRDAIVFMDVSSTGAPPPSQDMGSMIDPEPEAVGCACDSGEAPGSSFIWFSLILLGAPYVRRPRRGVRRL